MPELKVGQYVHYQPPYYEKHRWENGIVKTVVDNMAVHVVYSCGDDWDNYHNYTSMLTQTRHLKIGWKQSTVC